MQNTNLNNNKKTINEKELEVLKFWEDNNVFQKTIETPAGKDFEKEERVDFSFYDGPPFATGLPHAGHILAGTIKDSIPRYHTMQGKTVRRVWGWDCHGLPIENLVEKEFGLNSKKDILEFGVDKFNKAASDSVLKYESEWKKIVPRLGRFVDMEHSYKTMDWTFTESVWWVWKTLFDKGLAYEGSKMMHICPRCETPLAQSEVGLEYNDVTDISVTAKFELVDEPNTFVLAWTTTPWTLPGNTALAVNKNIEYVKVKAMKEDGEEYFILAKTRFEDYKKYSEKDFTSFEMVEEFSGEKLINRKYKPVFDCFNNEEYLNSLENSSNIWKIWHADFITDDAGTGIAHEAPAFGAEDMDLAKANDIPVIKHVMMNGHFTKEVEVSLPELSGLVVKKKDDTMSTDIEIIKLLAHTNKLFEKHKLVHSYPLCWRCKTPLLNYATSSWFVDVPAIKEKLISENQKVGWTPEHIRDGRFGRWLEGAREWAVSRSRYWGAPLPIWRSVDGLETKVVGSLEELVELNVNKAKNNYYIMRHAEAKSNVSGILDSHGDLNNHLTNKGVESVQAQIEDLKKEKITKIYCSPLPRALETAKIIATALNIEIQEDERLRETDLGKYDGKHIDKFLKDFKEKLKDRDNKIEGGESHTDMMRRTFSLVLDIEKSNQGENVLIVTHGGPAFMLINNMLNLTEEEYVKNIFSNESRYYLKNAEYLNVKLKTLPRDETGAINLHKPYIDQIVLKDSRGVDMRIIGDVFDCWFESGSMPYGQLHYPFENKEVFEKNFPADFIAEGMDQTRGWFYSLINLGVGLFDKSPYKHVIVNGVVMAGDGRKMSKSEKNYTDPMILVEKFGADSIRFALMNSPVVVGESVSFGDDLVEEVYKKNIQRLENVVDFYSMYNLNLNQEINLNQIEDVLNRWILNRLQELVNTSVEGYESYKLDRAVSGVTQFIDDLSTWYLRRSREKLKDSDVETYATLKHVLSELSKVVAPSMPFLAERVWFAVNKTEGVELQSVHLQQYPSVGSVDIDLIKEMKNVRDIVAELLMLRQRNNVPVRQPLTKAIVNKSIDNAYFEIVKDELNVKQIEINTSLDVSELDFNLNDELIREGKQRELSREIKDKRKELGLTPEDSIKLILDADRMSLLDEEYKTLMKINSVEEGESVQVSKA